MVENTELPTTLFSCSCLHALGAGGREDQRAHLWFNTCTPLFPATGFGRGTDALHRHAAWHTKGKYLRGLLGLGGGNEYEIHKAARAGALAIVVRDHLESVEHMHLALVLS
jgi:hypothetical protein